MGVSKTANEVNENSISGTIGDRMIKKERRCKWGWLCSLLVIVAFQSCGAHTEVYRDQAMDFGAVQIVAVMPFANTSKDQMAAERVRDVFIPMLLSEGAFYVLPPGEVARGIARVGINNPVSLSTEDVTRLGALLKVNALIVGTIREYGEIRSGSTEANVISLSLQMIETQTGKIVWAASSTKGGIKMKDRLLGGGGAPMNEVTAEAAHDLIDKLFQ